MGERAIHCPGCGSDFAVEKDLPGLVVDCPSCHQPVRIPFAGIGPGFELGNFVLEQHLCGGGTGEIWLAHRKSDGGPVAVKLLNVGLENTGVGFCDLFMKEIRNNAKINHPNIVKISDGGVESGIAFMVADWIEGIPLYEHIQLKGGILSQKESLAIIRSIAEGMRYSWNSLKCIHRGLTPDGIIITPEGVPKLFELSTTAESNSESFLGMVRRISMVSCYTSPELAEGSGNLDFRADIYALGAILYYTATGRNPYEGVSGESMINKIVSGDPVLPRKQNPELSEDCAMLIEILMAKKVEERPRNWSVAIADLDRVISGLAPATARPKKVEAESMNQTGKQGNRFVRPVRKEEEVFEGDEPEEMVPEPMEEPMEIPRRSRLPLLVGGSAVLVVIAVIVVVGFMFHGPKENNTTTKRSVQPKTLKGTPAVPSPAVAAPAAGTSVAGVPATPEVQAGTTPQDAEAEKQRLAEEEKQKQAQLEEEKKKLEEEQKKLAEEKQKLIEQGKKEEAERKAAEDRKKKELQAKKKAEREAKKKAEEEMVRKMAEEKMKILNPIVQSLTESKFDQASSQLDETGEKTCPGLRSILDELANADKTIMDSFKDETGKTISLSTTKGNKKYRLKEIHGGELIVEEKLGSAMIQTKLSLKRLSEEEKLRRLSSLSAESQAVYAGLLALKAKNYAEAEKLFQKTGVLSDALLEKIPEAHRTKSKEPAAKPGTAPAKPAVPAKADSKKTH